MADFIYNGFDDPDLPATEDLTGDNNYEVHTGSRTWKWDGSKWVLFSDKNVVNNIEFSAEIPIYNELQPSDANPNEDVKVTHFFDMNELDPLT